MNGWVLLLIVLLLCGGVSVSPSHTPVRADREFIYILTGESVTVEAYSEKCVAESVMIYSATRRDGTTFNVRSDELEIP